MKKLCAIFGISCFASNAIAATLDSFSKPIVSPVPLSPGTPGCGLEITQAQIENKDCGEKVDNPCIVMRKTADATLCGQIYKLAYSQGKNETDISQTVFVQTVGIDDTIAGEFAVSQWAWGRLCPYKCMGDNKCVGSPTVCKDQSFAMDHMDSGLILPGSTENPVEALPLQFVSVDSTGQPDGNDDSDEIAMVGTPYFGTANVVPFRFTSRTVRCPNQEWTEGLVLGTGCGDRHPCIVASEPTECGKCINVTVVQRGLREATPTLCKDGECPAFTYTKRVKIGAQGSSLMPTNTLFETSMGYWVGLCPWLCKDATSGLEFCVPNADHCLGGAEASEKVPAADGWGEYDEPGSMKSAGMEVVLLEEVDCDAFGAASRVASTGAAVVAVVAALALVL